MDTQCFCDSTRHAHEELDVHDPSEGSGQGQEVKGFHAQGQQEEGGRNGRAMSA